MSIDYINFWLMITLLFSILGGLIAIPLSFVIGYLCRIIHLLEKTK